MKKHLRYATQVTKEHPAGTNHEKFFTHSSCVENPKIVLAPNTIRSSET